MINPTYVADAVFWNYGRATEAHSTYTPPSSSIKRPRGTPTNLTPQRPKKKSSRDREGLKGHLNLDNCSAASPHKVPHETWTDSELKALVEFVLFYSTGEHWPHHKWADFWSKAGEFIQTITFRARSCMFLFINLAIVMLV